jgi:hypothetical protein
MKQHVLVALIAVAVALPLAAQSPRGWKLRVDKSTSASDPDGAGEIKFTTAGSGFHAVNPTAATYWNPANTATGSYTVKGTFTLLKPSGHNNYYGITFGGKDLEGAQQSYNYFVIAQNGMFLVKRREGDAAPNVVGRTAHDAIKKPGDDGKSVNVLEVRVANDKVDFVVNGTVVHSAPKTGALANTDGIYGIRVNHLLDVQIDGFGKS